MQEKNTKKVNLFVRLLGVYFVFLILGAVNVGSIGSGLKVLGFLPVILWMIEKRKMRKNGLVAVAILYTGWAVLSVLWSVDFNASVSRCISLLSFCLLLTAAGSYSFNSREILWLRKTLVWSSRITVITTLLTAQYYEGRLYLHGVVNEDPNYLCSYFLFGTTDCVINLFSEKKEGRISRIIELGIYLYTILATGSRGGSIAVACAVVTTTGIMLYRQQLTSKALLGRGAVVVALAAGFIIATNYVSTDIMDRFSINAVLASGGTGRFVIWQDTINTYIKAGIGRELGGFGAATSLAVSRIAHYRRINVTHNVLLENLIELGVVGLFLYIAYVLKFTRYAMKKKDVFSFSIMIGFIAMSISTSIETFKPYWNIMVFICCVSRMTDDEKV